MRSSCADSKGELVADEAHPHFTRSEMGVWKKLLRILLLEF